MRKQDSLEREWQYKMLKYTHMQKAEVRSLP